MPLQSDLEQISNQYIRSLISESEQKSDVEQIKQESIEKINTFYDYFTMGEWQKVVFGLLYKNEELNVIVIDDLIQKDVLSETDIKNQAKLSALVNQFYNFEFDGNFSTDLAEAAIANIHNQTLSNLSWYCDLLEKLEKHDLAKNVDDEVKMYLSFKASTTKERSRLDDYFLFGRAQECRFLPDVQDLIREANSKATLYSVMSRYYEHDSWNPDFDKVVLDSSTKDDWRKLIWEDVKTERSYFIGKMMNQPISSPEKQTEIHQWILEILNEKSQESKEIGVAIKHWLSIKNK